MSRAADVGEKERNQETSELKHNRGPEEIDYHSWFLTSVILGKGHGIEPTLGCRLERKEAEG